MSLSGSAPIAVTCTPSSRCRSPLLRLALTAEEATLTDETPTPESEPEREQWTPENDPDGYTLDDISPKDWYLDTVLDFVHGFNDEHPGGIVGLTVTSNGVVVSGLAISRAEWIAGVVDQYKEAGADQTATYIDKLFRQAQDSVIERAKHRDEADLPSRARGFLHLKDARLGAGETYTQVPLWRGALTDITGWSLGSWNPKQTPAAD